MGLRAADFWRLSLPEWRALIAGVQSRHARTAPLSRAAFEDLMERYPDA
ncbi:MAG: phage tail assembly chaperone [Alphaproteobacteria bacterium]|nr:phage tail assembly chaperone [Alphaproteobacteria bacterium]MDE2014192.1 phage tail assembly chaperone [Alphaproteobacteria bacterium]